MKTKRFRGNKPPPYTAGIPKLKPFKVAGPPRGPLKVYSNRPWRNKLLNQTVRLSDAGEEVWDCYLCAAVLTLRQVTIDHFIPRSKGGSNKISNLRPCCLSCNGEKADQLP